MSIPYTELDHIRVRFATYRDRSVDERAAEAERLSGVPSSEHVLLDTCHRVELVSVDDAPPAGRLVAGREAVRRVFEVVAGFDSAVIAEEQLLGQVRGAYEAALASGSTGPVLNELFRRALRFGRRVRTHARPGTDRSLADRGVAWLLDRIAAGSRTLVAGTGEMGRLAALRLAEAGHSVTIVSGSAERGGRLMEQLRGQGHRLVLRGVTPEDVRSSEGLVLAVRAREPLLTRAQLQLGALPWTLDLSTPAAVAHDAAPLLGERLLGLDRLGGIAGSAPVLAPDVERRLRDELQREVERFIAWLEARRSADALAVLHVEADAVRRRHLDRLRRRAGLEPEQLAAVEAAAVAMVGELLHGPTIELRRGGADAATVRRLFRLEA